MSKGIVKPTGSFILMLPNSESLHGHRPSVVTMSEYVNQRVLNGQIQILQGDVPDEASDASFGKLWDTVRDDAEAIKQFMEDPLKEPEPPKPPVDTTLGAPVKKK